MRPLEEVGDEEGEGAREEVGEEGGEGAREELADPACCLPLASLTPTLSWESKGPEMWGSAPRLLLIAWQCET